MTPIGTLLVFSLGFFIGFVFKEVERWAND